MSTPAIKELNERLSLLGFLVQQAELSKTMAEGCIPYGKTQSTLFYDYTLKKCEELVEYYNIQISQINIELKRLTTQFNHLQNPPSKLVPILKPLSKVRVIKNNLLVK